MLRVGLIGFGLAGQVFHAPVVSAVEGLELACILEPRASLAQQKYPNVRVARTLEELLDDREIRLCVIATPNSTHFDLAKRCMLAGRDVVVDKPLAITVQEAAELIRIAKANGRILSPFQNRRWDGDYLTVKKLLASGRLGRVVDYESNWDRFRPQPRAHIWREREGPGSGVLLDLGPHLIDQTLALFGLPDAITGSVWIERDEATTDDAFDIRMHYPQFTATLRTCLLAAATRPRFQIFGTQGSFLKHDFDPQEAMLRKGGIPGEPHWGEEPESAWGSLYIADQDSVAAEKLKTEAGDYRGFYSNVRDAILKGAELEVRGQDGLRSVHAIELVRASSERRCTMPWGDLT
jgi:scyllo-inositol 2-dehydrogenase (NADP+)